MRPPVNHRPFIQGLAFPYFNVSGMQTRFIYTRRRMWKIEYPEAGAIIKVLSRGCGRVKKGALKAIGDGSSELSTFHLLSPYRPHLLILTLITLYCNCHLLSSLSAISLWVSGRQGACLSAFCICSRSLPPRYCGFSSRPPE